MILIIKIFIKQLVNTINLFIDKRDEIKYESLLISFIESRLNINDLFCFGSIWLHSSNIYYMYKFLNSAIIK